MFQVASFTVSCCHFQHSLSTRKDCLCMRHATPCIRPATFTSAMQLHACDMQLHAFAMHPLHAPCKLMHAPWNSMHAPCTLCMQHLWNWIGSKQLNQSDASIIKVFDLCLATAHVIRNHCAVELLHPCTLHLLSTLIRTSVSDTVTLICLHHSDWSFYCCAVGTS